MHADRQTDARTQVHAPAGKHPFPRVNSLWPGAGVEITTVQSGCSTIIIVAVLSAAAVLPWEAL